VRTDARTGCDGGRYDHDHDHDHDYDYDYVHDGGDRERGFGLCGRGVRWGVHHR
jgi:hypothetical protein